MNRIDKSRFFILSALIATVVIAMLGIRDARDVGAETPEGIRNKQVKEIVIVTTTPKKEATTKYINFDLRHLSIVRQEGEADGVNSIGTESDGEHTAATETSEPNDTGTTGYSVNDSGDERSVGESDGSEMGDSGQEEREESELDTGLTNDEGWVYYGNCRITHYDDCEICCSVAKNTTASGVYPIPDRTVAAGEDLPFGTEVLINDHIYVVEDRGVNPGEIDIFVDDHQTALDMGMYYTDVYVRYE